MSRAQRLIQLLLVLFIAFAATPVHADSLTYKNDLAILGTYIVADDDRTDEYGSAVRVSYGKRLSERWWLEPTLFSGVLETGRTGSTDYYQQGAGVDFSYRVGRQSGFTPFLLVGLGASRNDVANNSASELGGYGNLGAGFLSAPFGNFGMRLRAEARYLYDSFDSGLSDIHLSAGIAIPIGVTRRQIVERIEYVEKPVIVEKTAPVAVADSDNDGVVDGVDQCPNTLAGLQVNAVGCVETGQEQSIVLLGVSFESGSARLTANARDILVKTADAFKGQSDLRVELAGHTDSAGAAGFNQQLSQQRADAVRNYLMELGVAPDQLVARGYGETRPIRSNDTAEGRERNRRVEFNVISE